MCGNEIDEHLFKVYKFHLVDFCHSGVVPCRHAKSSLMEGGRGGEGERGGGGEGGGEGEEGEGEEKEEEGKGEGEEKEEEGEGREGEEEEETTKL